jgi:hypothetical protein
MGGRIMSTIQIYDGEKFVPFNISNAIEMPVGFEDYVSYTELDPGQLIRNGQLVSREIYSDLWNFVQSKPSMLLTEEEWQANLTANEGLACNYYSAGDGSTTFRLPKASVIVLPDPNPENINKYSTDTQRNITGSIGEIFAPDPPFTTGAFSEEVSRHIHVINDEAANHIWKINFDASKSVGAEHTGEEVKPKSITKLPIVYAFGRIVNAGELDFQTVVQKQNDLTLNHQIKSFTDLTQIGLTNGIEQLQDIGKNLPDNSQITYRVWEKDNHNHIIYPSISGIFTMEKTVTFCRCFYTSITPNKQWRTAFDYRDQFYHNPSWELLAKNNKLSMPSNNKVLLSLTQQNQAWTAPSDGWVWAIQVPDGTVTGSWCRCFNNPDPKQATFGTIFYSDYGTLGSNDLCGFIPVAKGAILYFTWNNDAKIYFISALNANSSVYGEDVRIYIKAINIDGYPIKGAEVEIIMSSGYKENGVTVADGRYLLSTACYKEIKNVNTSSDMPSIMEVKVLSNEGSDVHTQYNLAELQENKIYDLEINIV